MKKLASLLLVFLLVGCTPTAEVTGPGGLTEEEVETVVFITVERHEDQKAPYIQNVEWETTDEVVDGIKENLINITGEYKWEDDIYKARVLMEKLPNKEFRVIRYQNITTGTQFK